MKINYFLSSAELYELRLTTLLLHLRLIGKVLEFCNIFTFVQLQIYSQCRPIQHGMGVLFYILQYGSKLAAISNNEAKLQDAFLVSFFRSSIVETWPGWSVGCYFS